MSVWVEDITKQRIKIKRRFRDESEGYRYAKRLANEAKAKGEQSQDRFYIWYGDPLPSLVDAD